MSSPESEGIDLSFRRRAGKEPERSSLAHTCDLLSLYFKERGANKAMPDAATAAPGTTMGLFPNTAKPTKAVPGDKVNLLPNRVNVGVPSMEDAIGEVEFRNDSATSQMTIFYAGKVIVYNDFPADKARDIMCEAEKHANSYCVARTPAIDKINFSSSVVKESNIVSAAGVKDRIQANGSDLPIPIATRSSLHRFFSKRKDRATARAPYQVNGQLDSPPAEAGQGSDPWAEVEMLKGQSSKQHIDLNL